MFFCPEAVGDVGPRAGTGYSRDLTMLVLAMRVGISVIVVGIGLGG